jgi:hypothetical protein
MTTRPPPGGPKVDNGRLDFSIVMNGAMIGTTLSDRAGRSDWLDLVTGPPSQVRA